MLLSELKICCCCQLIIFAASGNAFSVIIMFALSSFTLLFSTIAMIMLMTPIAVVDRCIGDIGLKIYK